MSISVDDLASSLSSSHIGQEAIDLALLQKQLAQAFFLQQATSNPSEQQCIPRSSYIQPCNTPTGRTPSSSFSRGQISDAQRRSILALRRNTDDGWRDSDETEEDERMVEDLLIPLSAYPTSSHFSVSQQHIPIPTKVHSPIHNSFPPPTPSQSFAAYSTELSPSLFTSTDPFYIAQLQAAQNHNPIFSHTARPSQQSPFLTSQQHYHQAQQRRENHGQFSSVPTSHTGFPRALCGDVRYA